MKCSMPYRMVFAAGLMFVAGMARADTPGYTFERVATLGEQFPGTNFKQITPDADLRVGSSNAEGGILIVCGITGGDGAVLFHSNGQPQGIVVPGNPSPAGGTFRPGL